MKKDDPGRFSGIPRDEMPSNIINSFTVYPANVGFGMHGLNIFRIRANRIYKRDPVVNRFHDGFSIRPGAAAGSEQYD